MIVGSVQLLWSQWPFIVELDDLLVISLESNQECGLIDD